MFLLQIFDCKVYLFLPLTHIIISCELNTSLISCEIKRMIWSNKNWETSLLHLKLRQFILEIEFRFKLVCINLPTTIMW
jgi:hypothetical protein